MRKIIVWTPINTSGHFLKLENSPKWMERRCEIMNLYTIPSMRAQTCRDFEWWIEVREDTADFILPRLKLDGVPAVVLTRPMVPDHGNGANAAWEREPAHVKARINEPEFIEVRLNSDDLYHQDFIGALQAMPIYPLTNVILPRRGYYWFVKEQILCKVHHQSPPFYGLIYDTEKWLDGFRHYLPGGHRAAKKLTNQDVPGRHWVWTIHDINNKIIRKGRGAYDRHKVDVNRRVSLDRLKGFGQ